MKKTFFALVAGVVAVAGLSGCSEKFDVAAPYKDYTVVTGLLDMADSAHYVRIQKAFLDNSKSALDMAQVPDSSYYSQLDVKIKVMSSSSVVSVITPTRVDLNAEGYKKDDGTFFTSPSYAYKFTNKLDPNYTYRLVITHTSGEVDSAETAIIDEAPNNNAFAIPYFDNGVNAPLDFSDTAATRQYQLAGRVPTTAATVEGIMRIYWIDENTATGVSTQHYADWDFATATPGNGAFSLKVSNADLYAFLFSSIGLAPANTNRHIGSVDMTVYAATNDYLQYQILTAAQNVGLTGNEIKPNFTNIKGKAVLGLFACRGKRIATGRFFSPQTITSFISSPRLTGLNIKD